MSGRTPGGGSRACGLAVGGLIGLLVFELDLGALISYWKPLPPFVAIAALTGALLWTSRPLRALLVLVAALLSALWLAVAFTPLCARLGEGLTRRDPLQAADAVFVLGSRLQSDGEPTTDAHTRLLHALALMREGHASRLVLSELRAPSRSYAPVARALMGRLGIEGELITVGTVGRTRDEAVKVGDLARSRRWRRVLVVTSPAHSRRACAALEREGVSVVCSPCVETRFDLDTLDWPDERLRAFGSLMHERVGLWVYRRRDWIR